MSRVTYNSEYQGQPVTVAAGWDNPLRGFFLSVGGDEEVYESLADEATNMGFLPSTDYFKRTLATLGFTPPEGFWERVELREGNVFHQFRGNGY